MTDVRDIAGLRVLAWPTEGPLLASGRDATDLIGEAMSVSADLVAIPAARLHPDFLRLSSGLAGEVLQKFVNYGVKAAILGDIEAALASSGPLRDFVYESNRGAMIWFLPDMAALEARLGG